jgi:hypothetical protein
MDKMCDCLDFDYRLVHNTTVEDGRTVPVEVKIRLHVELCYGPLVLGDLVYSTTLLPGEKVRLAYTDRRTKFSYDSETHLSYRDEQVSEEHYYLSSIHDFLSDITIRDKSRLSEAEKGSSQTHIKTSDFLEDMFCSPSVTISGYHDAYSTRTFLRELSAHVKSSDYRAEAASRGASSVSIGEVQTRNHAEGESEDRYESSSREFSNPNKCYAVTYFFYRINKKVTLRVTLEFVECRVIDAATNTKVTNHFTTPEEKLQNQRAHAGRPSEPLSQETREKARLQVEQELIDAGLLAKAGGSVSAQAQKDFCFERSFSLPTPGIIVKGCLDDCNMCEPVVKREYELELESKHLANQRLKHQIETGENS